MSGVHPKVARLVPGSLLIHKPNISDCIKSGQFFCSFPTCIQRAAISVFFCTFRAFFTVCNSDSLKYLPIIFPNLQKI